jgi:hypothetical protein
VYADDQAHLPLDNRKITSLVIFEISAYCRDQTNRRCPDSSQYKIEDRMSTRHSVKSKKQNNVVNKSEFGCIGPWKITTKLGGGLCKFKHIFPDKIDKRGALHLTMVP